MAVSSCNQRKPRWVDVVGTLLEGLNRKTPLFQTVTETDGDGRFPRMTLWGRDQQAPQTQVMLVALTTDHLGFQDPFFPGRAT